MCLKKWPLKKFEWCDFASFFSRFASAPVFQHLRHCALCQGNLHGHVLYKDTSYCLVLLHVPVHIQLTGTTCASTYYILTGTTRASTHHSIYWQVLRVRVWCRQHGLPLDIHGPLRLWRLGLQSRPSKEKRRLSMLSSKTILSMYYIEKNSSKRTSICHHFHGLSCLCVGPRVFFNIFLYFTLTEQRRGLWAQHGRCKGAFFSGQALWIPESSSLLNKCQV